MHGERIVDMSFLSMYGTDGCGKSTIAYEIAKVHEPERSLVIGGSTYKEWLTRGVARDIMGDSHGLDEPASDPESLTRLYEDIAIICYGHARRLSEDGHNVIVDSDPYLKRMIWGTFGVEESKKSDYLSRFNERMSDFLPDTASPDVIAGINVDSRVASVDILGRISSRDTVSEHDTKTAQEVENLDSHVRQMWSDISASQMGQSALSATYYGRLYHARMLQYENSQAPADELPQQVRKIARRIVGTVTSMSSADRRVATTD